MSKSATLRNEFQRRIDSLEKGIFKSRFAQATREDQSLPPAWNMGSSALHQKAQCRWEAANGS
jgi:hypothetical protein